MHPIIATQRDSIATLCRQFGVRRLDVFGSLLRDDFDAVSSDIDLAVELDPAPSGGNIDRYFGLKQALEALFERPVDLVELGSMPNTRLKRLIERSKVPVYGTAA